MKAVILAAGVGSRLGKPLPKSLNTLPSGKTIFENQLDILKKCGIHEIICVLGFKKEFIMERYPNILYRYNPLYHITNTSKSLMMVLQSIDEDDVVWLNGDVVLEEGVLQEVMKVNGNVIGVNKEKCAEEEVKYKTDSDGHLTEISKQVKSAEGEAIGVNKISKKDFNCFVKNLEKCEPDDYFEKAIEFCIEDGVKFKPANISKYKCIEVDFEEDLQKVWDTFKQ